MLLLVALIILLLSVLINLYLTKRTYIKTYLNYHKSLPDLFHQRLPYKNLEYITDKLPVMYTILLALLVFINRKRLPIKYILCIFIIQFSIILLLRCISFTLTLIPPPNKDCILKKTYIKYRKIKMLMKDLITGRFHGGCGDLLISGHMNIIILCTLYIIHYNLLSVIPKIIIWLITIVPAVMILISRCHYSIDIFYSYLITIGVFYLTIEKFKNFINI